MAYRHYGIGWNQSIGMARHEFNIGARKGISIDNRKRYKKLFKSTFHIAYNVTGISFSGLLVRVSEALGPTSVKRYEIR